MRIVLLGKTGAGKSSLVNTILEEKVFKIGHTPKSETSKCQKQTKSVNGRRITLIDTPGFFDNNQPEETLKSEIVKCIVECAPGPHAFLIVLEVGKFTKQEKEVVDKIQQYFSEEAFKHAVVVFTHGDQLDDEMKIEEFIQQEEGLSDFISKCGERCHVVDNKYWKNNQQDGYRSNKYQVTKLLSTIETMVDKGGCYTNEMLQEVERKIQEEKKKIRESSENMSEEEIEEKAKINVSSNLCKKIAGITTGALLGALLGVPMLVVTVVTVLVTLGPAAAKAAGVAAGGGAAAAATVAEAAGVAVGGGAAAVPVGPIVAGVIAGATAVGGAVVGGCIGAEEADQADSVKETVENTAKAVCNIARESFQQLKIAKCQQGCKENMHRYEKF